jgi:hypothetical protein
MYVIVGLYWQNKVAELIWNLLDTFFCISSEEGKVIFSAMWYHIVTMLLCAELCFLQCA